MLHARRFHGIKTLCAALALGSVCSGASAQTMEIEFKAPRAGQVVSGTLSGNTCFVSGHDASVTRVAFFLGTTALNTDTNGRDGMSCTLDTRRFPDGTQELRAVATDTAGRTYEDRISVNILNSATPPANTPPTVSITSPTAGQSVSGTLSFAANATDNVGVSRVEFRLDGALIATDTAAPYGGTAATPAAGTHSLTATAYDAAGLSSTSSVTFTVPSTPPANTPPTVSITSPTAGESVSGTLSYAANAIDNVGVSRVEFRLDGTLIATDTTAPYGGTAATPAAGTHSLTATAFDAAGLSSTTSVTFTVPSSPPANTPPTVSITSPSAGQPVTGTLTFAADATDNAGVSRVEFRLDGALIATDSSAPYSGSVAAPADGAHTLTATAYDAAGLTATSSVSFTVGQAPPPAACAPGATSAITVSATPSRINGIAPLSVFFDASATRASATARPFHDLEYRWSFGDPAGGAVWATGSGAGIGSNNSKNAATGPMASHVFESAGTYTVCVTVTDGANTAARPVTITVTSPDSAPEFAGAATLCVDSRARPVAGADGCPAGAAVLQSADFDAVINTTARNGAAHKRILFRRGGTYTSSTASRIHATGPGLVGAYGSGAKPLINGASSKLEFGSTSNLAFADWRLVDLNFDGQNQTASGGTAFESVGPFRQLTFLRVEARRFRDGILLSKWFLDSVNASTAFRAPLWSEFAFVDSTIQDVHDHGFLGHANRFSIMGSRFLARSNLSAAQNQLTHLVRLGYTNSAVISHNDLAGGSEGNTLTIRGVPNAGDRTIPRDAWTEKTVVSDNVITGGNSVWFFTIRRVNESTDARFRNILVERNLVVATPPTVAMLVTDAGELTVRNNLWNLTGAATPVGIVLEKSSLTPAGVNANISVYNNTAYSGSTGAGSYRFVEARSGAPANLRVRNNLSYAPALTGGLAAVSGTPGTGSVISHNTDGAAIRTSNPGFSGGLTGPLMWRATGSGVVNQGTAVPVWSDFFLGPRIGTYDLGAINPVAPL
jgi:hypothetical protein